MALPWLAELSDKAMNVLQHPGGVYANADSRFADQRRSVDDYALVGRNYDCDGVRCC